MTAFQKSLNVVPPIFKTKIFVASVAMNVTFTVVLFVKFGSSQFCYWYRVLATCAFVANGFLFVSFFYSVQESYSINQ